MSNEDKIAVDWIANNPEATARVEVPYNYYGSRGVVDLVLSWDYDDQTTYEAVEIKSESALRNATGANEVLRQFNRQQEYFAKGREEIHNAENVIHTLVIELTEFTVQHVYEHRELYASVKGSIVNVCLFNGGEGHLNVFPSGFACAGEDYDRFTEYISEEQFANRQHTINECYRGEQ